QQTGHVVNGHHIRLEHQERHAVYGDVEQVGGNLAQERGERYVIRGIVVTSAVRGDLKIGGQRRQLAQVGGRNDQRVVIVGVDRAQGLDQVADVRSDTEIVDAPDVDTDVKRHSSGYTRTA